MQSVKAICEMLTLLVHEPAGIRTHIQPKALGTKQDGTGQSDVE